VVEVIGAEVDVDSAVGMVWTLRGGANMLALITLRANSLLLPAALARLPRLYSKAYPLV